MQQQQRHPMLVQAFALAEAGRDAEAIGIIEGLARQGEPESLFTLGDAHWRGASLPQNLAQGRELFRLASDGGHPVALRAYTNLLASGIAGPRDWNGAIQRLREEAKIDSRRAQMLSLIEAMDLDAAGDPRALPPGRPQTDKLQLTRFERAFTPAECDFLVLIAEPTFQPSVVATDAGVDVRDPIRTSDGSTMHWLIEDPVVHAVNRRLAALSGTRVEQGEPLQILRYRPGQQYRRHVDWLGPDQARVITALIYLNEEYEGGETQFPKAGVKIRGRKGDAIVFKSVLEDGRLDPMSEHAGLPVTKGAKFLASRWIRAHRYVP
jgi:prolyl 4-hydroxylase